MSRLKLKKLMCLVMAATLTVGSAVSVYADDMVVSEEQEITAGEENSEQDFSEEAETITDSQTTEDQQITTDDGAEETIDDDIIVEDEDTDITDTDDGSVIYENDDAACSETTNDQEGSALTDDEETLSAGSSENTDSDGLAIEEDEYSYADGVCCGVDNYQENADRLTSEAKAKKYIDSEVNSGKQYICFWINSIDSTVTSSLLSYAKTALINKHNDIASGKTYYGTCKATSPYPNETCIQAYTYTWLGNNSVEIPDDFTVYETADGVRLKWSATNADYQGVVIGNCIKEIDKNATVYDYMTGAKGTTVYFGLYLENKYTYAQSDLVKITLSHDGKVYACKHKYSKPSFKWNLNYVSCTAASTCTLCGQTKSVSCSVRNKSFTQADFSKSGKNVYIATTSAFGSTYTSTKSIEIPQLSKVKLKYTSIDYSGKACKPSVKVYDKKGNVVDSKYYSVSYSNNKNVGTAKCTLIFNGLYTGTKTVKYQINLAAPALSGIKGISKGISLKTGAVPGAEYYVAEYSLNKSFKNKKTIKFTKTSGSIKGLKSKQTYYIRVYAVKGKVKSQCSKAYAVKTK